ncbi:MAG: hypothetical protein HZB37_04695 [Planctomycetes bacterium]|nr:hypothetical protein [Planctomycetota bacterium]
MLYVFVGNILLPGFRVQTFNPDLLQNGLWKGSIQAEGDKICACFTLEVRKIATMVYS